MKISVRDPLCLAGSVLCLLAAVHCIASAPMKTTKITGPFDVKMAPQSAPDAAVGRFTLEKQYHGDLAATATGEMLAAMTATKGSAGYVAIEKVTGKLAGRTGTMAIKLAPDSAHTYEFEYALSD